LIVPSPRTLGSLSHTQSQHQGSTAPQHKPREIQVEAQITAIYLQQAINLPLKKLKRKGMQNPAESRLICTSKIPISFSNRC
jgi:hypothetical protein